MAASPRGERRRQQDGGNGEKARQDGHGRSRVRGRRVVRRGTRSISRPGAGMSKYKGRGRVHNPGRGSASRSFRSAANCCQRWNDGGMRRWTGRHAYAIRRGGPAARGASLALSDERPSLSLVRPRSSRPLMTALRGKPACAEHDAVRRAGISNKQATGFPPARECRAKEARFALVNGSCARAYPARRVHPQAQTERPDPRARPFQFGTRDNRTRDRPEISPSCSRSSDRSSAPARPAARRHP